MRLLTVATQPGECGRSRSDAGLSLVEVTVMLSILMILAGALIPVVSDSIGSARLVRARNDVLQISVALTNFQRDVGPFVFDGSRMRLPQTSSSLRGVDVLMSEGDMPAVADEVPVDSHGELVLIDPSVGRTSAAIRPWVAISSFDLLDFHLRTNGRGYPMALGGPGTGWNGPYVTKAITGDPWGNKYLINTGYLRGLPPSPERCTNCAVFVISAGPNGVLETPFRQPLANASVFGDDLAVRIQ